MTIIRSPRVQRDFTIISNSVCLDARLSMRALGLLVRLLCRPDNWQTNSETLAREFGCGREQMRSVLFELSAAGYMKLQKSQDAAGRWSSAWVVFDEPVPEAEDPKPGKPGPGKPYVGALGPITRTDLPRTNTNPPTPKGECLPAGFADFWSLYPKKVGKDAAVSAWKRKVKAEDTIKAIMSAVEDARRSDAWAKDGGRYIPNPATWLNQGRWKDGDGNDASSTPAWMEGVR